MQLDRQQQQDVQRPEMFAPDPVGGLERPDAVGPGEHDVQVHRSQKEQGETREYLPEPQRRVFVAHHPHVAAKRRELAIADREFAHRKHGVDDDERDDDATTIETIQG